MLTQSYSKIPPTTPQPPAVTTNDPCYKCEDGWKQHGGKCYFFSTSKSSWNERSTECITKGGDLVKIDSSEEQSFLRIAIQQKLESYDNLFWIGLTDSAVEGRWLWVDGSPLNESQMIGLEKILVERTVQGWGKRIGLIFPAK
ncbi:CD209 antigen-like protein A [Oreochromis aureus]|uniref:CD209 antigen-like protein A n=1 Tax=Oreochromis aureus TaxID=47969 RepID=UPI0019531A6E|nr:CD209 antigen-like protein A [Oreochromis aureus]